MNDADALRTTAERLGPNHGGVMIEAMPWQGEGCVRRGDPAFFAAAHAVFDVASALSRLLVCD